MLNLKAVFRLIRWKNLFIVTYIFFILKFVFFSAYEIPQKLNNIQFIFLLVAVLLIMAAGYIINDIFDIETDVINKKNNIISKDISIEKAKRVYFILNVIGILFGVFLCLKLKQPKLSFIFFVTPLLLYYYSKKWKSKPLVGNLIVSLIVAFSSIILILFDIDFNQKKEKFININYIILFLFWFAFVLNLIREVCKDIEDVQGDYKLKMNTLPIFIGRNRTKNFVLFLISILAISVALAIVSLASIHKLTSLYLFLIVLFPIGIIFFKLKKATAKIHFKKINIYLKIIMFLGINTLLILSIKNNVL